MGKKQNPRVRHVYLFAFSFPPYETNAHLLQSESLLNLSYCGQPCMVYFFFHITHGGWWWWSVSIGVTFPLLV